MQLILDADNIDVERNMSTIEQEPLNEKLLNNKVIEQLADDIKSGNKENIQKQNNRILNIGDDDFDDPGKEITDTGKDILLTDLNEEKSKEGTTNNDNIQIAKKSIEDEDIKTNPEQLLSLINENLNEEQHQTVERGMKLEKAKVVDAIEVPVKLNDTDPLLNHIKNPDHPQVVTLGEVVNTEILKESNEANKITLNDVNEPEIPIELKEEIKNELDEELDFPARSFELTVDNIELDKKVDDSNTPQELKGGSEIEFEEKIDILKPCPELNVDNETELHKKNDNPQTPPVLKEDNEFELEKEIDSLITSPKRKEETETELVNEADIPETLPKFKEDNDIKLTNKVDISEKSPGLKDQNEIDLDKELDISELSTELNEEKAMDLDRDFEEISKKDNDIEVNEYIDSTKNKKLKNESNQEGLKEDMNIKTQEMECSETKQKNFAIEIDDDDEKTNEEPVESDECAQEINEIIEEKDETTLNKEIKLPRKNCTIEKISDEPALTKRVCKLSNNLDIFSDDEEDNNSDDVFPKDNIASSPEKQCINIDDDDDIMLIDEDSNTKESKRKDPSTEVATHLVNDNIAPLLENTNETCIESNEVAETFEETKQKETEKDITEPAKETTDLTNAETNKIVVENTKETKKDKTPLLPKNFVQTFKKNLAVMTRDGLEEFCILKIVESIVDRSNLGEIKTQLKKLTQTIEECKKKCLMLTKQNKDLQIVLRSVQDDQNSGSDMHITPLKITRSVGMQVVMLAEKNNQRKNVINCNGVQSPNPTNNTKQIKTQQIPNTRNQKEKATVNQQIPVPRLVPAAPPAAKSNQTTTNSLTITKQVNNVALQNGVRTSPPVPKMAEKRGRSQAVTVDLTDDEPPAKLPNVQRGPVSQPMRVLTAAPNLIPAPRFAQNINSPRKVYIPISGPQAQNVRPGQTIMLKALSALGPRPRAQIQTHIAKSPQTPSPVRFGRGQPSRHPAPLPDATKQYQPPNWKALPPAPDIKLSKVENGIVISWKIDGYQEDNHEEIASYQLYAYQETSSPPNTALWKKIGDVKALPLPMACTLTQFMAGFKYYFAVRAVDVRSRFGPFSLPGSILLLNQM